MFHSDRVRGGENVFAYSVLRLEHSKNNESNSCPLLQYSFRSR